MLNKIDLINFRNYPEKSIKFNYPISIITGKNASGKTNILEAIFTSLFTKSFRSDDKSLILKTKDNFRINAGIDKNNLTLFYSTHPSKRKVLKINNKVSPLRKHIGKWPVVLFEPNTIHLFSLNSSFRRGYLDILLFQLDPKYINNFMLYKKTLLQRNAWLWNKKKQGILPSLNDQIYIYNIQLATAGSYISKAREKLVKNIQPFIEDYYYKISEENISIAINYTKSNNSEADLLERIQASWQADSSAGRTLVGPHREDFNFVFNNLEIESFASRGELRSTLLALKLSELHLLSENSSNPPLLLLDDVFSELDENRQVRIIENSNKFQTIITTTHLPKLNKFNFDHIKL